MLFVLRLTIFHDVCSFIIVSLYQKFGERGSIGFLNDKSPGHLCLILCNSLTPICALENNKRRYFSSQSNLAHQSHMPVSNNQRGQFELYCDVGHVQVDGDNQYDGPRDCLLRDKQ